MCLHGRLHLQNQGCDALSNMQRNLENLCHICIEGLGFLICSLDEGNVFWGACKKGY